MIVLSNPEVIEYFKTLETPPRNIIGIYKITKEQYTEDIDKIADSLKTLNTKNKEKRKILFMEVYQPLFFPGTYIYIQPNIVRYI